MPHDKYEHTRQQRIAKERTKRIRERSGPDSLEWVQSALFLYAAHQNGLGGVLHQAVLAYTAAMIDKLENILTEARYITGAQNIAEEYRWAAKQLRVAIARHLNLLKMFEKQADIVMPPVTDAGKDIVAKVHNPTDKDTEDALRYMHEDFKGKHPGYSAVIPDDLPLHY